MSWALFIDESGQDRHESPYEVLAGIAVEDRNVWPLIRDLSDAQEHIFGIRLFESYGREAKAKKLLKRKTFRLANSMPLFEHDERKELARALLQDGTQPSRARLAALSQAKIEYCSFALTLAERYKAQLFASIIPTDAPRPENTAMLRKDYAYLFERFFHFLNAKPMRPMGYMVFDELDRSQSHILLNQVSNYFVKTRNGRSRARLIIPEPFFVHSDLTTLIQLADIIAYIISWGFHLHGMKAPARPELSTLAEQVMRLRYCAETANGNRIWGTKLIADLRAAEN